MAVRGRFRGSVQESDFLYDFPCSPCEKDGRNVEAIKHCVDCGVNMCMTCIAHHNKFDMMRGHKVVDQVQTSQGQTKQLPSQRCSKHDGKIIDVFCPEHDTVGCSTCISVDHSSCKGKKFIPDVAAGIKTSREVKQLQTEMTSLKTKLKYLKKRKGDNMQRLEQDEDDIKKDIKSIRKKMNEQLDKMEKQLVDEVKAKFKQKMDAIHANIAEIDDMLARLKVAADQLKSDSIDADIFVSCKIVKREMFNKLYPLYARVEEQLPERSFELHTDEETKLILEGKGRFISIEEKYTIQMAEYKQDINILMDEDEHVCAIFSICALPDGSLVMTDCSNEKLKKLNPVSNNVSTLIILPDKHVGLCTVDNSRLAVALHCQKKIQYVSLSGKVTLGNSFSVGDQCRGLAHCDGLIFVCCGGSSKPESKEGRGHVEVYNYTGELLRCLYEEFRCPECISVINDGYNTTVFTAEFHKGVMARRIDGTVKHRYQTLLKSTFAFCPIGTDQLCIGECSTENVSIHTYNDKHIIVDGVNGKPVCLYFDKRSSRLFVALHRCNVIKVFDLRM